MSDNIDYSYNKCQVCKSRYEPDEERGDIFHACSAECGKKMNGTPCGYSRYGHDHDYCTCNPKFENPDYCQQCFGKLVPFKKYPDWEGRKYHKTCWKRMQRWDR